MQHSVKEKSFETLLALYNQEIETLKEKLLNGESWDHLKNIRKNITELAIALHKMHNHIVDVEATRNAADVPQQGKHSTTAPV